MNIHIRICIHACAKVKMGLHIILDLDDTLIGNVKGDTRARPHLGPFLKFCFAHFDSVSIWTAATREWWGMNYGYHIAHHMGDNTFARVYTSKHCEIMRAKVGSSDPAFAVKPLSKLWDDPNNDLNEKNTIIVDDNALTAVYNTRNLIHVREFSQSDDKELLYLANRLSAVIAAYAETQDVQKIDLRAQIPLIIDE
jgi:hypothetical protein